MKHLIATLILASLTFLGSTAQPKIQKVELHLIPDRSNALYQTGEYPQIRIMATDCGMPLNGATVNYEISHDLMPSHKTSTVTLAGNEASITIGTMDSPGFMRLKATTEHEGKKYTTLLTVGFDPHLLTPTVGHPDDFIAFWEKNIESASKNALSYSMTLLPERCSDKVDVYHISYSNISNSKMYGILTMPHAPGKYPAILRFPGAGVGEKGGDIAHAAQGVIILELGIHGIPVNLSGSIYADLSRGALASYHTHGIEDKSSYYYKRVYLGCVRGVDFLLSLPQCNGSIGTLGGSQGGALSIATSALDKRIKATAAYFPALSDMEGYCHNRAGGWPHIFKNEANRTQQKLTTMRYYDTANFARHLTAPVFYAFGYNDLTCAPTTTQSVYNVINVPKQLSIGQNTGHWLYPEQTAKMWQWLIDTLKSQ